MLVAYSIITIISLQFATRILPLLNKLNTFTIGIIVGIFSLEFILIFVAHIFNKKIKVLTEKMRNIKEIRTEREYYTMLNSLFTYVNGLSFIYLGIYMIMVTIIFWGSSESFLFNEHSSLNSDDILAYINISMIFIFAVFLNINKINMISEYKIPQLIDIEIDGESVYTGAIIVSNTEDFYFIKLYANDKELAISKNHNIRFHRNNNIIFNRKNNQKEVSLKTKNNRNIRKK